jgi:hypothetical protein
VRRLRILSESECYTRLYGEGEATVRVFRAARSSRRPTSVSGEALRRIFEERLDAREADVVEPQAA